MDKLKILVVDDESRMRKLVRDFLVRQNYEVLEAGDGEEALDIFYEDKDIALIILDVMMPKMNGWEVCKEIRETSKVPIIMLTAKSDESDELMGFDLGVDEYISKLFHRRFLWQEWKQSCEEPIRSEQLRRIFQLVELFWTRQHTW